MTNIASECRIANIVRDHAMILPDDATPKPNGIFGKDTSRHPQTMSALHPKADMGAFGMSA